MVLWAYPTRSTSIQAISEDVFTGVLLPLLPFAARIQLAGTCAHLRTLVLRNFAKIILDCHPDVGCIPADPIKEQQLARCVLRPCWYYHKSKCIEGIVPPELWSDSELFLLALLSHPNPKILSDAKLASVLDRKYQFLDNAHRTGCNHSQIGLKIADNLLPLHSCNKEVMAPFLALLDSSRSKLLCELNRHAFPRPGSIQNHFTNPLVLTHYTLQIFHFLCCFCILYCFLKDHLPLIAIIVPAFHYAKYMYNNFLPF